MSYHQDSVLGEVLPDDALHKLVRPCVHVARRFKGINFCFLRRDGTVCRLIITRRCGPRGRRSITAACAATTCAARLKVGKKRVSELLAESQVTCSERGRGRRGQRITSYRTPYFQVIDASCMDKESLPEHGDGIAQGS
jgi:hypothetical protein